MEQMLMEEIGAALGRAMEHRSFPRMAVSGDIAGAYETTIKDCSMLWVLTGCTTLGNPIVRIMEHIIGLASARSKYEREHLQELLQGKTEFTIYE
jgi:hypothetical protein